MEISGPEELVVKIKTGNPAKKIHTPYSQIEIEYGPRGVEWCFLNPRPKPCFNPTLLAELIHHHRELRDYGDMPVEYMVLGSRYPDIFNYGGDLSLFGEAVEQKNRKALLSYGQTCVDAIFGGVSGFYRGITTIALVQGTALGGGFESALACDLIIAEEQSMFGFPEILFNLFPGMGAYSLLSRRIAPKQAMGLILSGKLFPAKEMQRLGVIDVVVPKDHGVGEVISYIRNERHRRNGTAALRRVHRRYGGASYEELMGIVEEWADAVLELTPRDIRLMNKLAKRQEGKISSF